MHWAGLFDFRPDLASGLQRRPIVAHNYPRVAHNIRMFARKGKSRASLSTGATPRPRLSLSSASKNLPDLKAAQLGFPLKSMPAAAKSPLSIPTN
jgi:hypothetical protein